MKSLSAVSPLLRKYYDLQTQLAALSFSKKDTKTYVRLRGESNNLYARIVAALPVRMLDQFTVQMDVCMKRIERCTVEWRRLVVYKARNLQPNLLNITNQLEKKWKSLEKLKQQCKDHFKFTPFLQLCESIRKADLNCQYLKHRKSQVKSEMKGVEIIFKMENFTKKQYEQKLKALQMQTSRLNDKYRQHRKEWRAHIKMAMGMAQSTWFPEVAVLDWIFFQNLRDGLHAYGGILSEQKLSLLKYVPFIS